MDITIALLACTFISVGLVWPVGVWIREKLTSRRSEPDRGHAPIIIPAARIPIPDPSRAFIPMPDSLTKRGEMVEWMTQELPKLTREKRRSDR